MPPVGYIFWAFFLLACIAGGWGGSLLGPHRRWFFPSYVFVLVCIFLLGYKVFN